MAGKDRPEKTLTLLLHEVSDCLAVSGGESGSEQSGAGSLNPRVRDVLDTLLDHCVDEATGEASQSQLAFSKACAVGVSTEPTCAPAAVTERELTTMLKLLTVVLDRFPAVFCSMQHIAVAFKMLQKLLPLSVIQHLRCPLCSTLSGYCYGILQQVPSCLQPDCIICTILHHF